MALRSLYANRWVRYALTLLLLVVVVWRVRPGYLVDALSSARPIDVGAALLLTVPFLYLKALRWYVMLRAAGSDATFGEAAISLVGGMGLALVTPARLGELVRVAYLRDREKWKIGGLVLLDKGFDVLVLCGLSVAGAATLLGAWAGAVFAVVTAVGLLAVYGGRRVAEVLTRLAGGTPFRSKVVQVAGAASSLNARSTTIYLALTVLAFAVVLIQFGIVLLSWHRWSPDIVLLTFPLVILTNILPLTVGGLGLREGAAALLLAHFGVAPADAALAAFLMFALNTALPGVIGAFLLPAPLPAPQPDA